MTSLDPSEILVEIQIPQYVDGSGSAYHKVERKVGDYATSGAAVYLELDGSEYCKQIGPGHTIVTILCDDGRRYASKIFNKEFLRNKNLPIPKWL